MNRGESIPGFDYVRGVGVSRTVGEWRTLELQGFARQVDGAKGETWYRDRDGRLAFEAYANIPAARPAAQESQS